MASYSRCLSLEESRQMMKEKIISLYRDVERFLKSDEYTDDLREELQQSNPDYLTVLEKRIKDIERVDHGIVIAGETSAGKSTLINKILGMRIFKGRNKESTSTICKIRNLAKTRILTESMTGQVEEIDLTEKNDAEKALRASLKKLADMTCSKEGITLRSVDIGFPIPFLKGNTIIVDTPGIGGSGKVTEKLMEYLPNALSFIFVINAGSAGGMQCDRLPEILRSIVLLQMENEMPCFDCENVIFITNKWDTINVVDSDSSEEDEETKTWNDLIQEIKENWPFVKEENIFKMNLKYVFNEHPNWSTTEFERFRKVLELNVLKAENIRVERHLSFLLDTLKNISKGLTARLELGKRTEQQQLALSKVHEKKITELTEECNQVMKKLKERLKKEIKEIAKACADEMSQEEGKHNILNPEGEKPIMKTVKCDEDDISSTVKQRVVNYVKKCLSSQKVVKKFVDLDKEVHSFYEKMSSKITSIENDWVERPTLNSFSNYFYDAHCLSKLAPYAKIAIATSPLWITAIIGVGAAFLGICVAISPIALPVWLFRNRDSKKKELIDKYYNQYQSSIEELITNELESKMVLKQKITNITEEVLLRRLLHLKTIIYQLSFSRRQILANREQIGNLFIKLEVVMKSATSLEEWFKHI